MKQIKSKSITKAKFPQVVTGVIIKTPCWYNVTWDCLVCGAVNHDRIKRKDSVVDLGCKKCSYTILSGRTLPLPKYKK